MIQLFYLETFWLNLALFSFKTAFQLPANLVHQHQPCVFAALRQLPGEHMGLKGQVAAVADVA